LVSCVNNHSQHHTLMILHLPIHDWAQEWPIYIFKQWETMWSFLYNSIVLPLDSCLTPYCRRRVSMSCWGTLQLDYKSRPRCARSCGDYQWYNLKRGPDLPFQQVNWRPLPTRAIHFHPHVQMNRTELNSLMINQYNTHTHVFCSLTN
jgi:hypothetical protein